MTYQLAEAIALVSEFIGRHEAMANMVDTICPGSGHNIRHVPAVARKHRAAALTSLKVGSLAEMNNSLHALKSFLSSVSPTEKTA